MEQIRQLLSQMALNLELNIAMCDKIAQLEERLDKIEPILKSHGTKIDAQNTRLSEITYTMANRSYEARTGEKRAK